MDNKDNPNRKTIRIPLMGGFTTRQAFVQSSAKDQYYDNVLFDVIKNPVTAKETLYTEKVPGFTSYLNVSSKSAVHVFAAQGITGISKNVVSFWSTASGFDVYVGNTLLGTQGGSANSKIWMCNETKIGSNNYLAFSSASTNWLANDKAWYIDTNSGAIAQITDADYPGNVVGEVAIGNFVFMNGYAYMMGTSGKVYNSDLNSISSWSATGFIQAQAYPDSGVGLARYKNNIVAFGNRSIEFFEDVGNPTGSPLQVISQATIKAGTMNPNLITQIGDKIYFAGTTNEGDAGVYEIDNYKIKKLNDRAINLLVQLNLGQSADGGGNLKYWGLYPIMLRGKMALLLSFGAEFSSNYQPQAYIYDFDTQMWQSASAYKLVTSICQGSPYYQFGNIENFIAVGGNGQTYDVYTSDNASGGNWTQGGSNASGVITYVATVQTSKLDFGSNMRKRIHRLRLIGDRPTTTCTMNVSWSDDDYQTFSTARTIDMSAANANLPGCGSFRRRAFKIVSTASQPNFRIEAIEVDYSELDH